MTSREQILGRVRAAMGASPGSRSDAGADTAYAALPRPYLRAHHDPAGHDIVALFAERAADYRAVVERVAPDGLPGAITRALIGRADAFERIRGAFPQPLRKSRPGSAWWSRTGCRRSGLRGLRGP